MKQLNEFPFSTLRYKNHRAKINVLMLTRPQSSLIISIWRGSKNGLFNEGASD